MQQGSHEQKTPGQTRYLYSVQSGHTWDAVIGTPIQKTPKNSFSCQEKRQICERGGSNPPFGIPSYAHERDITDTQTPQNLTLKETLPSSSEHLDDTFEHRENTFLHEKCVICVSQIPEDLATVVHTWDSLPAAVKAGIMAMVKAARPQ